MNWFTSAIVNANNVERNRALLEQDSGCEHVEKDIGLAYALRKENDTFGTVSSYLCCKACDEKADEEEGNVEEVCNDCGETHKAKDGIAWKWYDFYAAQGDEPLQICNKCRIKDTHVQRCVRDRADYEAEFGGDDQNGGCDDGDDYPDGYPDQMDDSDLTLSFTCGCGAVDTVYQADLNDDGPMRCSFCREQAESQAKSSD